METINLNAIVGEDRMITIRVPTSVPLGPVELVVIVNPSQKPPLKWDDIRGLGKEIWEGIDVEKYINDLRGPWPDEPAR